MAVNDVEASNFTYMLRCSRHFLSTLVFVTALGSVHAAELGEARVSSHTGQPLVADIELVMIDDPSAAVAVRIASPEVYNGAGIAMPPVLGSVNLSVMRRDGRQFLHVTSLRPVDADHLHLYLELQDKGQRAVRLATLWLTPDPNPAPPPLPAVVRAEPAALPAPAREPVAVPASRPLAVRKAEEPLKARPHARAPAEAVHAEPKAAPLQPLPIHAPQPAPAACAHQAEQARVCAALDARNAALTAKIGNLEGKVKSLQATLGAPAAAAPAPTTTPAPTLAPAAASTPAPAREAAQAPPGPKPIHAIKPLVPRKPKAPAPAPEAGLPWGWMGGGAALLLALAGAFLLLRRRARTVRNVDIPAAPRLVDRLRGRLPTRGKAASKAVEPSLE